MLIPDVIDEEKYPPSVTKADGAFAVQQEGYISDGPWWVYARHEERELAGLLKVEESEVGLSLRLHPGAWVTATMVDQAGEGVPGIVLRVEAAGLTRIGRNVFPGDNSTDGSGQVTVGPLPDGIELTVRAGHGVREYALDLPWDPSGETVRLLQGERLQLPVITLLPEGWRVTGTILDADGKPAAGAVVRRSRGFGRRPTPFEGHEYPTSVTADAQGRFAMPGLPSRRCILIAVSADGAEAASLMFVPAEQHEVEFRLAPPGSVVGVAYDADGKPVAGMKLGSGYADFGLPPGGRFATRFSTRTDERGGYRIDELVAGFRYSLQYMPPGTNHWEHTKSFTAEGGEVPHVVDIYLEE